jgi:hypothetical protein
MGVGTSSGPDAEDVGATAAAQALDGRTDARLVIVFCNLRLDLAGILRGVNRVTGGVPLIGCSTAGELTAEGPTDDHVVVTVIGGPGFQVATRAMTGLAGRQREAGAEAAACFDDLADEGNPFLLMLMDGHVSQQEEVLRGVYGVLGAGTPLVGGCAGDSLNLETTYLFHGGDVLRDALVVAAVRTAGEVGIGVAHGYQRLGEPLIVTSSVDGRVLTLDDLPALDVYLDRLGASPDAYSDQEAFRRFSFAHPLGIGRRSGLEMRFVASADFEARALVCLADVPEGGVVSLCAGETESLLDAAAQACDSSLSGLSGAPAGLIAFDCIARRTILDEPSLRREVGLLTEGREGIPLAGFYSHGEIARVRGANGFHNQTLVVLAVS